MSFASLFFRQIYCRHPLLLPRSLVDVKKGTRDGQFMSEF